MKIRFAGLEDAEDLFRWRTDPATMKFSLSEEKIELGSHLKWFRESLANKKRVIMIAELDGEKAGMVRFDETDDKSSVISIAVSPEMRGKGIGTELLGLGCSTYLKNWKNKTILATIKKINVISIKLFTRCGFKTRSEDDEKIVMGLDDEKTRD